MAPCEAIYMLDSGTVMPDIRVLEKHGGKLARWKRD